MRRIHVISDSGKVRVAEQLGGIKEEEQEQEQLKNQYSSWLRL